MAFVPALQTADYLDLLLRLSPPGRAWHFEGGRWESLLRAVATEFARHNLRAAKADLESDPRTADETIESWEQMLGITTPQTLLEDRQGEAHAHLIATGGGSVSYFTELAAAMGIAITISDPLAMGWTPSDPPCAPLYAWTARYVWTVTGPAATFPSQRAALENLFQAIKPGHTVVVFSWTA